MSSRPDSVEYLSWEGPSASRGTYRLTAYWQDEIPDPMKASTSEVSPYGDWKPTNVRVVPTSIAGHAACELSHDFIDEGKPAHVRALYVQVENALYVIEQFAWKWDIPADSEWTRVLKSMRFGM